MMRPEGWRAPKSGVGYPHGKDKRIERAKRTQERLAEKQMPKATGVIQAIVDANVGIKKKETAR